MLCLLAFFTVECLGAGEVNGGDIETIQVRDLLTAKISAIVSPIEFARQHRGALLHEIKGKKFISFRMGYEEWVGWLISENEESFTVVVPRGIKVRVQGEYVEAKLDEWVGKPAWNNSGPPSSDYSDLYSARKPIPEVSALLLVLAGREDLIPNQGDFWTKMKSGLERSYLMQFVTKSRMAEIVWAYNYGQWDLALEAVGDLKQFPDFNNIPTRTGRKRPDYEQIESDIIRRMKIEEAEPMLSDILALPKEERMRKIVTIIDGSYSVDIPGFDELYTYIQKDGSDLIPYFLDAMRTDDRLGINRFLDEDSPVTARSILSLYIQRLWQTAPRELLERAVQSSNRDPFIDTLQIEWGIQSSMQQRDRLVRLIDSLNADDHQIAYALDELLGSYFDHSSVQRPNLLIDLSDSQREAIVRKITKKLDFSEETTNIMGNEKQFVIALGYLLKHRSIEILRQLCRELLSTHIERDSSGSLDLFGIAISQRVILGDDELALSDLKKAIELDSKRISERRDWNLFRAAWENPENDELQKLLESALLSDKNGYLMPDFLFRSLTLEKVQSPAIRRVLISRLNETTPMGNVTLDSVGDSRISITIRAEGWSYLYSRGESAEIPAGFTQQLEVGDIWVLPFLEWTDFGIRSLLQPTVDRRLMREKLVTMINSMEFPKYVHERSWERPLYRPDRNTQ